MASQRSCHFIQEVFYDKYKMHSEDAQNSNLNSYISDNTDFDSEYVDEESNSTHSNSEEPLFNELLLLTDQSNILLAKITLLHMKGEDKKLYNSEPLLNLLRHFLSITIDDEIFTSKFEKLKDIY
ncbi:conserved hypothetical protein [Histoplasma capsulatum var. duboisii H88]|uniref:Uncharacterized protein n=1 Tax=Ajellomyces capsulatus (strain H88) TaxID=544711 RepID=F0UFX6_AJEC8|nr:conserved hypothetical protein [Histoplasma capsulatum var. duboisii H88]